MRSGAPFHSTMYSLFKEFISAALNPLQNYLFNVCFFWIGQKRDDRKISVYLAQKCYLQDLTQLLAQDRYSENI